jgi:hypothetical protein
MRPPAHPFSLSARFLGAVVALTAAVALPAAAAPRAQVTVDVGRGCDRKAVHREVDHLRGKLGRCLTTEHGQAQVRIRFRPDGTRRDLRSTGDQPRPVLRCLERRLKTWTSTPVKGARTCEVTLALQRLPTGTDRPHAEQQQELGKPE